MSLTYPYALFALIAIPIVILIYILKNKYRDETAPSTYLWELSEKFLKKRNPLRKMEHLLALIMQCLAIAGMAFALARPVFTVKDGADNIVFVVDGSASMSMKSSEDNTMTRFDMAKSQIVEVIRDANVGSQFTIIIADDNPRVVCKSVSDKEKAEIYVDSLTVSAGEGDLDEPINMAQEMFSSGLCNVCYLATDRPFLKADVEEKKALQNINLIDVSDEKSVNYAISDLSYEYYSSDGKYWMNFTGSFISYNQDLLTNELPIRFYLDDTKLGSLPISAMYDSNGASRKNIEKIEKNTKYYFDLTTEDTEKKFTSVTEVKAVIEKDDALEADNTAIYYNTDVLANTKALLVQGSDAPLYMSAALKSVKTAGTVELTTISEARYNGQSGYDVYIFDSCNDVSVLPETGTCWFVNCTNISASDTGFKVGDRRSGLDVTMKYAGNTDDILYNQFVNSIDVSKSFALSDYIRYSLDGGEFTSVISYNNTPIVFAGMNDTGRREVVFALPLDKSNLCLNIDFVYLVRNFINYSNPTLLKQFTYEAKQKATFSISSNIKSIQITSPDESSSPLDIEGKEYVEYQFNKVGTYKVTVTYIDSTSKQVSIYASYPEEEENPYVTDYKKYNLVTNVNTKKGDGLFDNILPFVIVAAVLFIGDWALYTHEQY